MTDKHEWRKAEKALYLPKNKPVVVDVPGFQFLEIAGEGSPAEQRFSDCIRALYSLSYTIKMSLKKLPVKPQHYVDYAVYPLEGVWSLNEAAIKAFDGTINKSDFVYTLMIRQPDFISAAFYKEMLAVAKKKNPDAALDDLKWVKHKEGKCIQMLHVGSFDTEPASFALMESFAESHNLMRQSRLHREVYLSDFRKVAADKLKTILRFSVA